MNSKTKMEKCSSLASWEREVMQMRTLSLSWASKPPNSSSQVGIPRGQARGEMQSINGAGIGSVGE
jgi:hypothetical protein